MTTRVERRELADVLADWRGEAAVLRRRGDERAAKLLEQCASEAAIVSDEFTMWLSETDAALRAGWSTDQVRRHARKFLESGHVAYERRAYRLRACIVPRRAHPEMVRAQAERGAA
jgi:hypothetical protein